MLRFGRMKGTWMTLALLLAGGPAAAESIYWVDTYYPAPSLGKADADGLNPVTVPLPAGSLPEGLVLEEAQGHLYWAEAAWSGAGIGRATVSLGGLTGLVAGGSVFRDIDVDLAAGKLYWTSSNLVTGSQVHRSDLDGTNAAVLANLGSAVNLRGLVLDHFGDRVYLADYDGGQILVHDLAGAAAGDPIPAAGVWGVARDAASAMLYWTDYAGGRLMRTDPGTGTTVQVLGGLGNPTYLDVDPAAGNVYWVEAAAGAQRVMRARLDGDNVLDLGLPIGAYGGITVGPDAPTPTLLALLQAEGVEDGIEVRWQFVEPGRFTSTRIERAVAPAGPWSAIQVELREESGRLIALDRGVEAGVTYHYRLEAIATDGTRATFGPITATAGSPVTEFALSAVSPNPARGAVRIDYAVPRECEIRLAVLDVQGRRVATLYEGLRGPGRHQAVWSGAGLRGRVPAGLYFVRLLTPERQFVRRLVVQD